MNKMNRIKEATLGSGCFWCSEALFKRLKGVENVISGYAGGNIPNPSYQEICNGKTGHAEVIRISFDETIIGFKDLLEVFWNTHDPTTLNRQGADVGTHYRSVVFYHDEVQQKTANEYKDALENAKIWKQPIVTEISPLINFFPAGEYHNNYFENNPYQPYCSIVIAPKVERFKKIFKNKIR